MIQRLVIHGFRGIREGVLKDLDKVNLLIGPNNSGKTAILEMLYLGGTSGRPISLILDEVPLKEGEEAVFRATTSGRRDFLGFEPFPRLRRRHGYKGELTIPTWLTEEGGLQVNLGALTDYRGPLGVFRLGAPLPDWGVEDTFEFTKEDIMQTAIFSIDAGQQGIPSALIPRFFVVEEVTSERYRWHYLWDDSWVHRWARKTSIDYLAVWAEEGRAPDARHVLLFDFHTANNHFNKPFAQWAKGQPWDWTEKIRKHLVQVFPGMAIKRVEVDDAPEGQEGETGYIRTREGRLPIDHFGDGTRHAFKVLAALIPLCEVVDENHPGLFLWEDPELFMHPESLNRLLRTVMQLIKNKPIQVFCSSQSLEVIALFTHYFAEEKSAVQDRLRAFRLDLEDGRLYAAVFHFANLRTWLEQGMDPRHWGVVDLPLAHFYREDAEPTTEEDL